MGPKESLVMPTDHYYTPETLRTFAVNCLRSVGVPGESAEGVADNLIDADLRGIASHGVARLIGVYVERLEAGIVNPAIQPEVIAETISTVLVNAHNGLGAPAGMFATDMAIRKAKEAGSAWVAVSNSNHFGTCSYYTNRMAGQGMVGLAFTNAPSTMAPWGGIEPYLGTNPIGISVPTSSGVPLTVDLATSVAARGHIFLAATKGQPIPVGWAQDKRGRPTTNAQDALEGSVLPMGGHKGYALAFMIDVLSGILTGSGFGRQIGHLYGDLDKPQNVGHLIGAIDIERFVPINEFHERLDQMIDQVKTGPLADWADEILVPGEPEARHRRATVQIPVSDEIWKGLVALADRLAIEFE